MLVDFDVGFAYDAVPLLDIGADMACEVGWRARQRLEHVGLERALAKRGIGQDALHLGVSFATISPWNEKIDLFCLYPRPENGYRIHTSRSLSVVPYLMRR